MFLFLLLGGLVQVDIYPEGKGRVCFLWVVGKGEVVDFVVDDLVRAEESVTLQSHRIAQAQYCN
jgi:hypothetical protein